jgi:hypothetical protein
MWNWNPRKPPTPRRPSDPGRSDARPGPGGVIQAPGYDGLIGPESMRLLSAISSMAGVGIIVTRGEYDLPSELPHRGGGVLDLRTRDLTDLQVWALLTAADRLGHAAFDLGPPSYQRHIHIVLDGHPALNDAGKAQLARYRRRPLRLGTRAVAY